MDCWGELKLVQITYGGDFWSLMDEIKDDKFYCNRNNILESYKNNNLYGLRVDETEEIYNKGVGTDEIFCDISSGATLYLLPCFCIKDNDTAKILWTHPRARNNGFATKLVHLLGIKYACNILPESKEFWKKLNIGEED